MPVRDVTSVELISRVPQFQVDPKTPLDPLLDPDLDLNCNLRLPSLIASIESSIRLYRGATNEP